MKVAPIKINVVINEQVITRVERTPVKVNGFVSVWYGAQLLPVCVKVPDYETNYIYPTNWEFSIVKNKIIAKFLHAVQIWRDLVIALRNAQKRGDSRAKSALMRSMFYWRKEAENLKRNVDAILFCKFARV